MYKNKIEYGLPDKIEYGLPDKIDNCKTCLMSNQRPNMCDEHNNQIKQKKVGIYFEDGICEACIHNKNKVKI